MKYQLRRILPFYWVIISDEKIHDYDGVLLLIDDDYGTYVHLNKGDNKPTTAHSKIIATKGIDNSMIDFNNHLLDDSSDKFDVEIETEICIVCPTCNKQGEKYCAIPSECEASESVLRPKLVDGKIKILKILPHAT